MKILQLLFIPFLLFATKYEIRLSGNKSFDSKTIYTELGFEQKIWDKIFFKKFKPKVDEKLLKTLQEEIKLFYKQEGFWKTDVKLKKDDKQKVATYLIKENKPIIIKDIEITSNFPIKRFIKLKKDQRFNIKEFKNSKEFIKKALLKKGYCSYDFNPKAYIFLKKNIAYLVYYLEKGDICKIKSINVNGLKTISKRVVLDHIYLKPKENFSLERVKASYQRLYSLEYFNSVIIDYSKKINNQILADINLKEREKIHIYRAGVGYESSNGPHINFLYKNLNFYQNQLTFNSLYSKNIKSISFKLFTPSKKILKKDFDIVNEIAYKKEIFDSFDTKESHIGTSLLTQSYDKSYKYSIFWDNIKIFNNEDRDKNGYFNIVYPQFDFILDKRDSKIFPKNGYYFKNSIETSLKSISTASYIKDLSEIGFYKTFKLVTLFLRGRVGVIDDFQGNLPSSKLFFAGGLHSNRAYSFHKIFAADSKTKNGGKTLLETTIENSFPLYEKLRGAIFWDRTVLSKKKLSLDVKAINGVGFGFRYPTIIGNFIIDFGFDVANFSQNAIHFSIGTTF